MYYVMIKLKENVTPSCVVSTVLINVQHILLINKFSLSGANYVNVVGFNIKSKLLTHYYQT